MVAIVNNIHLSDECGRYGQSVPILEWLGLLLLVDYDLMTVLNAQSEYLQIVQFLNVLAAVYEIPHYHHEIERNGAVNASCDVSVTAVEHNHQPLSFLLE